MTTVAQKPMTAAEFAALDIDAPVELVRGEIIEMPRPVIAHGIVCKNVTVALDRWAETQTNSFVVCNDAGVLTASSPDTIRGPDVFLFQADSHSLAMLIDGYLPRSPDLVVEVLSPSERWQDVIAKIDEYFTAGTQEVWIVDPELRQLQQHRIVPPPVICRDADLVTSPLLPEFAIPLAALFRGLPADPRSLTGG